MEIKKIVCIIGLKISEFIYISGLDITTICSILPIFVKGIELCII